MEFLFAGAVPTADKATGQHQPRRCRWHGGDQDESLHTTVQGLDQHTLVFGFGFSCWEVQVW